MPLAALTIPARLVGAALLMLLAAIPARAFETRATSAWIYDLTSDTVLLEKNADVPLPPASMSKLMTINMLFEALKDGRVSMTDTFGVSQKAAAIEGSTMFLETTDRPTVEDLIKGMIVLSGNDACIVVAEGLGITEDAFAQQMNKRAKALGFVNSSFANASGWPHPNQRMSMHDLGRLAVRLITEFPEYYGYFSIKEFQYEDSPEANRHNRNPLLKLDIGADGLKTGHTAEAGYGIVGSAVQGGRRVVFVLSGLASDTERAEEAENVVNWAFRQFVQKTIAKGGDRLAEADVWMGTQSRVGLTLAEDAVLLMPALAHDGATAEIVYTAPLRAPIAKGDEIGTLVVTRPDLPEARLPLVADADIDRGGFPTRLKSAAEALVARFMPGAPSF